MNIFLIYPCQKIISYLVDQDDEPFQSVQIFFPNKPTFTAIFGLN